MPRVAGTSRMCSETTSHCSKKAALLRGRVAVGHRALARRLARPDQHPHAERPAVAGHGRADPAVAVNAQRLAAQRVADARSARRRACSDGHLLRQLALGGEDQPPGELGGGVGRRARVLVRRDDDAAPRAGLDVDVRIDAALADQAQAAAGARAAARGSACARGSAPAPRCRAAARPARRRPGRGRSRSSRRGPPACAKHGSVRRVSK